MRRLSLDTENAVYFYEQDFYVLSNFSAFRLHWHNRDFDTSEQAYQWMKFQGVGTSIAKFAQQEIVSARSAHDAFKIAERHKIYVHSEWKAIRVPIMKRILLAKQEQHEYVRRKLLASGERQLIENSWRDDFWGWGENRDGQNMLGKLWMEIRSEIR